MATWTFGVPNGKISTVQEAMAGHNGVAINVGESDQAYFERWLDYILEKSEHQIRQRNSAAQELPNPNYRANGN